MFFWTPEPDRKMYMILQSVLSRRGAAIPIVFLLSLLILSILIPFISPYAEDIRGATHFQNGNKEPSLQHWFGTDSAGRDVFTLTVRASISSLKIAFGVVVLAVILGTPLGLLAGTIGGWVDEIIMRIADGFLAFPPLILPLTITAVLGPSLNNMIIGIAISWFPWYIRIARSQAIIIRSMDYVLFSKSMGSGNLHMVKNHILPNSISPIVVQASIDAGFAILMSAGLSFIGLGAQPPEAEWGLLITQSRVQFLNHWWVVTFPGLFIVGTVLSFNMIGDELRNILNPRLND